jgi:hypothetical protein
LVFVGKTQASREDVGAYSLSQDGEKAEAAYGRGELLETLDLDAAMGNVFSFHA